MTRNTTWCAFLRLVDFRVLSCLLYAESLHIEGSEGVMMRGYTRAQLEGDLGISLCSRWFVR